ncbi:hypothetical protein B0T24DRAFT_124409 [Lasiosphaeria ovina]|uniref:Uncharacterized protein n=1 Tax=Lasiosphaeria ovina TaxID=92902 RepID=A0AAE0JSV4_9PEZI|nr:hypothetical protein B0T24DRAFT_124409 [Lasiosphaeria ovina]
MPQRVERTMLWIYPGPASVRATQLPLTPATQRHGCSHIDMHSAGAMQPPSHLGKRGIAPHVDALLRAEAAKQGPVGCQLLAGDDPVVVHHHPNIATHGVVVHHHPNIATPGWWGDLYSPSTGGGAHTNYSASATPSRVVEVTTTPTSAGSDILIVVIGVTGAGKTSFIKKKKKKEKKRGVVVIPQRPTQLDQD